MQSVETQIYASHSQFYVVDPEAEFRTDLVWDGAGLARHLGASAAMVAVGTVGYCTLPVRIELWSTEPPADLDDWDHVVEASLQVSSGRLSLEGVEGPGDLAPLDVATGTTACAPLLPASTARTRWRAGIGIASSFGRRPSPSPRCCAGGLGGTPAA